jgi:hypothetical protein
MFFSWSLATSRGEGRFSSLIFSQISYKLEYYRFSLGKQGIFLDFFYVLYSILLHLSPLRFHRVGGCWDCTQDCCDIGIGSIFIEQTVDVDLQDLTI